jgi:hypothetical protein
MRARDNPFATARLHQLRYRLAGATWGDLLSRLEQLAWRAAVVGPHGSGKTTFLEAFAPLLHARGFETLSLRLSEDRPCLASGQIQELSACLGSRHIVLLDGAEQLGRWDWLHFNWRARGAGGLIITTHQPGRLPTLWQCETTPDLFHAIVRELVPDTEVPVGALFQRHAGNLREALRELYDLHAAQPGLAQVSRR